MEQAIAVAREQVAGNPERASFFEPMIEGFLLGLAAAAEDLDEPGDALAAYDQVLAANPGQPRARSARAHLLLAWGELDAGARELDAYLDDARDEQPFLDGAMAYLSSLRSLQAADIHPREFLVGHRESYVEMFDHYAAEQAARGWIAEAARMRRDERGRIVPSIPEGARPYAALRVDLVNPQTSEVGQVGDQPMVVALAGYEPLARAPALLRWRDLPFDLRVSTQAPWDQLPIQVAFDTAGALDDLDAVVGDWYLRGWDGAFGDADGRRFHYISDPEPRRDGRAVTYHCDLGRARVEAIDDLVRRLGVLHASRPIGRVILGRGYLPRA
jgi:tetratricopeptide (TPR) repeat protein